ncbi:site-specific integrase [Burkholderia sp. AU28942]|uniref:phage integrase family protein n=1 Tax=Burkholderia TaxID=32008 RepID=UPI000841FCE2|nr:MULTISPECIES: phage integrase family protein [Burkholderia]AOK05991.1 integrase [Burkholderia latens]MCA8312562.1 site-specific integrase [Burkholderia sp. AU28942]QTO52662.1 site-specific integrase [Burkholderia latens]
MANRPQQLAQVPLRSYSRTEFTALRARVKGLPIETIERLYFDRDAAEPVDVAQLLRTMRDDLVAAALRDGSPVLKSHLQAAIEKYGEPRLTPVSLQLIEQVAAQWAIALPQAEHPVGRWFRSIVAARLEGEGIHTLGELVAFVNRRGGQWWRSVPRIGVGRARVLVAWLRRHAAPIGAAVEVDVDAGDALAPTSAGVTAGAGQLAPLERLALPDALSGAHGANRAPVFAYLGAAHDLDAVRAYLHRYDDRPATQRVYKKELERLVLWCVAERSVALSSMRVEDCEAYKAFLAAPGERFTGPPVARTSRQWRPFAPGGLAPESQRYAVRAIRAAFTWLVAVRYLAGNPWAAVSDPSVVKRVRKLQVERALPLSLWTRVRATLAERGELQGPSGPRWRAARALLLLMGDGGLRIAEAAAVTRAALVWMPAEDDTPASWLLEVIGKGNKQRYVPISDECVDALRAHWRDRGQDLDEATATKPPGLPLVAPLVIPPTPRALEKFGEPVDTTEEGAGTATGAGYSVRGARGLTQWAIAQLLEVMEDLSEPERRKLASTSPHAFRHTVGTQMLAAGVALEVVQRTLGHASLGTTSIYVSPEEARMRREAAKYHARLAAGAAKRAG